MDADELKALLEAAAREISAVITALPDPRAAASPAEAVADARRATSEAGSAVQAAAQKVHCAAAVFGGHATDAVCEARAFCTEATRKRDEAEAELWGLRSERDELLEKMQELTEDSAQRSEHQRDVAEGAAAEESALLDRCNNMDFQVDQVRRRTEWRSRRLFALGNQTHMLGLNQRKIQRQHADAMVENVVAREILELQQCTEAYLGGMSDKQKQVKHTLTMAQLTCGGRLDQVESEWCEQQERYKKEMDLLESRIAQLDVDFEGRWQTVEEDRGRKLEGIEQQLAEARTHFESQVAEIDKLRAAEKAATDARIKESKRKLVIEKEKIAAEMEAWLQEKRAVLTAEADAEHARCEVLRASQRIKLIALQQELKYFQGLIKDVANSYRGGFRMNSTAPGFALSPPRSTQGSEHTSVACSAMGSVRPSRPISAARRGCRTSRPTSGAVRRSRCESLLEAVLGPDSSSMDSSQWALPELPQSARATPPPE